MNKKRIVVIGGGTGTFAVLQGLSAYPYELSAIISAADDGGSTGILRDELGVLPPGDLRQALVALSPESPVLRQLFNYRFEEGSLKGHSFGNLLLSALEKVTGHFDKAVLEAGKILNIRGQVLPVTTDEMRLHAETVTGEQVHGEHAIEGHIWSDTSEIQRLWLDPDCNLHPLAKQAILRADLIVIAPGSVYTSLIPNFLVRGAKEALRKTKGKVVYIANLMTEKGQGGNFTVQDFADLIQEHIGERNLDYVVYNTKAPSKQLLERYKKEMERTPVKLDRKRNSTAYTIVGANLLSTKIPTLPTKQDQLSKTRTLIRHDPKKLGRVLNALVFLGEAQKYLK